MSVIYSNKQITKKKVNASSIYKLKCKLTIQHRFKNVPT